MVWICKVINSLLFASFVNMPSLAWFGEVYCKVIFTHQDWWECWIFSNNLHIQIIYATRCWQCLNTPSHSPDELSLQKISCTFLFIIVILHSNLTIWHEFTSTSNDSLNLWNGLVLPPFCIVADELVLSSQHKYQNSMTCKIQVNHTTEPGTIVRVVLQLLDLPSPSWFCSKSKINLRFE